MNCPLHRARRHRAALLLLASISSACAPSIAVDTRGGLSPELASGGTYSWRATSLGVTGDPMMAANAGLDHLIRGVIDEELQVRGYHAAREGEGDIGITYVAAITRELRVDEVNDFLRYRRGLYASTWVDVEEFERGTLVIDVTDPSTGDLLWRGAANTELHSDDAAYRERKLREGVQVLLDELASGRQGS